MAERTVAQLLREAATALDEQRGVGSATNMPAPDRTGEGRANRDKFCTATEFTAILLLNYPALRDCGGYQLLRARGTTRSKCLIPIDCPREGSHQQSTSAAQTSAQSSAAPPSAQSAAATSAAQSAASTSAAQSAAPPSAAQSAASTSAAQSAASTSAAQSSAQSAAPTSAAQSAASTSAAQTSAASTSSTGRVSEICNEEWKLEPDTKAAAKMFQTHLLKDADQKPTLKLTLDMHVTEEDRERAIIGFYKQTNIDWTRPFEVQLKGDCAIGDGVKKYFFSLCLNKLQTGLHLHLEFCEKLKVNQPTARVVSSQRQQEEPTPWGPKVVMAQADKPTANETWGVFQDRSAFIRVTDGVIALLEPDALTNLHAIEDDGETLSAAFEREEEERPIEDEIEFNERPSTSTSQLTSLPETGPSFLGCSTKITHIEDHERVEPAPEVTASSPQQSPPEDNGQLEDPHLTLGNQKAPCDVAPARAATSSHVTYDNPGCLQGSFDQSSHIFGENAA
ncbi:unnamed protein product [Boreogadus saida]